MIKNIAQLLKGIMDEESKKLDIFELKHAPTIGKMYEGLTSSILEKTIPISLNLQVVNGVIYNELGQMSGEIDCMLVKGNGEQIPYTQSYKWHIKYVVAVFEVKKTLYKNDLTDSFEHLRGVLDNYISNIDSLDNTQTFDASSALRAFAETTGVIAPSRDNIKQLPFEQEIIYHTLLVEQISPLRIVIGYNGYKSEYSLRKAFSNFLSDNLEVKGFGINSFPNLIISGAYSLVKMNGQPYSVPMQSDFWDFYTSSRVNPILLILELLWTRLSINDDIGNFWGEDLLDESFAPFLSGIIRKVNDKYGWEYKYTEIKKELLSTQPESREWEPMYVSNTQFVIFERLCNGKNEQIDNTNLLNFLKEENENPDNFFQSLVQTGLVAIKNKKLELVTKQCQCAILPNGKYAVAENNSGRFTNWINKHYKPNKA